MSRWTLGGTRSGRGVRVAYPAGGDTRFVDMDVVSRDRLPSARRSRKREWTSSAPRDVARESSLCTHRTARPPTSASGDPVGLVRQRRRARHPHCNVPSSSPELAAPRPTTWPKNSLANVVLHQLRPISAELAVVRRKHRLSHARGTALLRTVKNAISSDAFSRRSGGTESRLPATSIPSRAHTSADLLRDFQQPARRAQVSEK